MKAKVTIEVDGLNPIVLHLMQYTFSMKKNIFKAIAPDRIDGDKVIELGDSYALIDGFIDMAASEVIEVKK